ncbi:MAG: PKD domain-containing protein [Candidatus Delongbacteria bacterium]|nr:PKD domain-containing protein [Candidatus Delongbacteria bacterium]MBN2835901.1 PKD domain-containing protein [Candidatus Delongbacteria bacterium]
MKNLFFLLIVIVMQTTMAAPNWVITNTGISHSVNIPENISPKFDGVNLSVGDYIGAFYSDGSLDKCGGYIIWSAAQNNVVTLWGDDPNTASKDGFTSGETIKWKVYRDIGSITLDGICTYQPEGGIISSTNLFEEDGVSQLSRLYTVPNWSVVNTGIEHTINIPQGIELDGVNISVGDYVGVFYELSGNYFCGGFTAWNGTEIEVIANGDFTGSNGFEIGENFSYRIWDRNLDTISEVYALYENEGIQITAKNQFEEGGFSKLIKIQNENKPNWAFVNTGNNHSINIKASIDVDAVSFTLSENDYIGCFYEFNGIIKCAGYKKYINAQNNVITVFGEEYAGSGDGLANGQEFSWKLWKHDTTEEFDFFAEYSDLGGIISATSQYQDNGVSEIFSISDVSIVSPNWEYVVTGNDHTINLNAGVICSYPGLTIEQSDYIGAFYDKSGVEQCAGYKKINIGLNNVIAVFGAESAGVDNGFEEDERISWKLWKRNSNETFDIYPVYSAVGGIISHQGFYSTGGVSEIIEIKDQYMPLWSYTNTGNIHSLNVPPTVIANLSNVPFADGDYIGAFYSRNGEFYCAGMTEWHTGVENSIAIYGETSIGSNDGFSNNEIIDFRYWRLSDKSENVVYANYEPLGGSITATSNFLSNGLSQLTGLSDDDINPVVTINLNSGQQLYTKQYPIKFKFGFSENIVGLASSDFTFQNGINVTSNVSGSNPNYILTITNVSANGQIVPMLPESAVFDSNGNGNDASGNQAFVYFDTTAPVINLIGENVVDVQLNTVYSDAGYVVSDNISQTANINIITTSSVNTSLVGQYVVTYTATDQAGNQASVTRTVNVVDLTNFVPEITGQLPISIDEDNSIEITLNDLIVNDTDNVYPDDFSLTVQDGLNYTRNGNTITPTLNYNGPLTVPVIVNDGIVNSATFDLAVTVNAINDAPVITGQLSVSVDEDSSIEIALNDLTVTDIDNAYPADFTLTVQDGLNYTRDGNTINPIGDFNGFLLVPVYVNDGTSNSNIFELTVSVLPVNDSPYFTSSPVLNGIVGVNYQYSITIEDIDNQSVNIYGDNLPAWLNVNSSKYNSNATLSGVPSIVGDYSIKLVADDGSDLVYQEYVLHVTDNGISPIAQNIIESIDEDSSKDITLVATDDLDPLTSLVFEIVGNPTNGVLQELSFNKYRYTPNENFNGIDSYTYQVRDTGNNISNLATVDINIISVNDAPVVILTDVITGPIAANYPFSFENYVNDVETANDALEFEFLLGYSGDNPLGSNGGELLYQNGLNYTYIPANPVTYEEEYFIYNVKDEAGEYSNTGFIHFKISNSKKYDSPKALVFAVNRTYNIQGLTDNIIEFVGIDVENYLPLQIDIDTSALIEGELKNVSTHNINGPLTTVTGVFSSGNSTLSESISYTAWNISGSANGIMTINVASQVYSPVIVSVDDISFEENKTGSGNIIIDDPDSGIDKMTFDFYTIPNVTGFNFETVLAKNYNVELTVTPPNGYFGDLLLVTTVTDQNGLSDSETSNLIISPLPDHNIIVNSIIPSEGGLVNTDEETSIQFSIDAVDPDGNPLSYTWLLDNQNVGNLNAYEYIPDYNSAGTKLLKLTVTDNQKNSLSYNWQIVVSNVDRDIAVIYLDPAVNNNGIWTPTNQIVNQGDEVSFSALAYDPDTLGESIKAFDWSFTPTDENHVIVIQNSAQITIDNVSAETGDYIGVFYNVEGELKCGGYVQYAINTSLALAAWSDDVGTEQKDGFENGENIVFKLYDVSENKEYIGSAIYQEIGIGLVTQKGMFAINGFSEILTLNGVSIDGSLTYKWFVEGSLLSNSTFLNYTTPNNFVGVKKVKLSLESDSKSVAEYNWNVTVNDVDFPIVVNSLSYSTNLIPVDQQINETEKLTFNVDAYDPDGNEIQIKWYVNNVLVSQNATYDFVSAYLPADGYSAGNHVVRLDLYDGVGKNTQSFTWNIEIFNVNQQIVVNNLIPEQGQIVINELESVDFSFDGYDPDLSIMSYAWYLDNVEIVTGINSYTYITDLNSGGMHNVKLVVSESFDNETLNYNWDIQVNEVDQNIVVNSIIPDPSNPVITDEITSAHFEIDAIDPDGNTLVYNWLMDGVSAGNESSYEYIPNYNSAGNHTLTLSVSDGFITKNSINYQWDIIVSDVNRPMVVNSYTPVNLIFSMNEGESRLFSIDVVDPDNSNISYEWSFDGLVVSTDLQYSFIADYNMAGNHLMKLTVIEDGYNEQLEFDWDITIIDINTPIVIQNVQPSNGGEISVLENSITNFEITAIDPDGSDILYNWILDGASVSDLSLYNFNPDYYSAGYHYLQVYISDGADDNTTISWQINVIDVDQNIVVNSINPDPVLTISIMEGEEKLFEIDAVDPDGNDLEYIWYVDGVVKGNDNQYAYTPSFTDEGNHIVSLNVKDNYGSKSEISFAWNVIVSDAPIVVENLNPTIGSITIIETESVDFSINAYEPSGNQLLYNWTNNGVVVSSTSSYEFITDYESEGVYNIHLNVVETSSKETLETLDFDWVVTVQDNDQALVVNTITPASGDYTIEENQVINFYADAYDPDGDIVNYNWLLDGTIVSTNQNYEYSTDYNAQGIHAVTLTMSDRYGLKNVLTYNWNITVLDIGLIVQNVTPEAGVYDMIENNYKVFSIDAYDPDYGALKLDNPGWEYTITENNHIIIINNETISSVNGLPLMDGDYIGVFYNENDVDICAGLGVVNSGTAGVIVWGDDPTTPEKDGLIVGEEFDIRIWQHETGSTYRGIPEYKDPDGILVTATSQFMIDGISVLTVLNGNELMYSTPSWTYTNTGTNHTIILNDGDLITTDGERIADGDYIGVFYLRPNGYKCGGYSQWVEGKGTAVQAWGDDPTTAVKDGFDDGERFTWKIWRKADNKYFSARASYVDVNGNVIVNGGSYSTDGISAVKALRGSSDSAFGITYVWTLDGVQVSDDMGYIFATNYNSAGTYDLHVKVSSTHGYIPSYEYSWVVNVLDNDQNIVVTDLVPANNVNGQWEPIDQSIEELESIGFSITAHDPDVVSVNWDWSYTNTGYNHTIVITPDSNPNIGGYPLVEGDLIGAYYFAEGTLKCAGYIEYTPGVNRVMSVWADDPTTEVKDGYADGEILKLAVRSVQNNQNYFADITFIEPSGNLVTHTKYFEVDGVSKLSSLSCSGAPAGSLEYKWTLDGEEVSVISAYTYQADLLASGDHTVKVNVKDPTGSKSEISYEWNVEVNNVHVTIDITNLTPASLEAGVWTPIDQIIDENQSVLFTVEAEDPNGSDLVYRWSVNGALVNQTPIYEFETTFLPENGYSAGNYVVTLEIDDGYTEVIYDYTWNVVVNDVDLAIVIESINPDPTSTFIMNELDSQLFEVIANDPDGNVLSYTWMFDGSVVQNTVNTWTYSPDIYSAGLHTLEVTLNDGFGAEKRNKKSFAKSKDIHTITWNIQVNDVPQNIIVNSILPTNGGNLEISEEDTIDFSIDAYDPDGNDLIYEWLLDGVVVAGINAFTYMPDYDSYGDHIVVLNVSDGNKQRQVKKLSNKDVKNSLTYTWNVHVTDVDRLIVIDEILPSNGGNLTVAENSVTLFSIDAYDPDGNDLTYSWVLDNVVVSDINSFSFEPDFFMAGNHELKLNISDNYLYPVRKISNKVSKNSMTIEWNITVTDVNQNMVVNSIIPATSSVNMLENETVQFAIDVVDPDNSEISYNWKLDGASVSISSSYSYFADYNSQGTHSISLEVTEDGYNETLEFNWQVVVENVDLNIIVNSILPNAGGQLSILENESINFSIDAFDPDGNDLSYSWKFDGTEVSTSNNYNYYADYNSAGNHTIELMVSDGDSKDLITYNWTIIVQNVNRPVVVNSVSPDQFILELTETESQLFNVDAIDPDGDVIYYSWKLEGVVVSETSQFEFVTDYNSAGTYNLEMVVTDTQNKLSKSKSRNIYNWTITVIDNDQNIIVNSILPSQGGSLSINESETINFVFDGVDPDGNDLIYEWILNSVRVSVESTYDFVTDYTSAGSYELVLNVNDGTISRNSLTYSWDIIVVDVDRPIVIDSYSPEQNVVEITELEAVTFSVSAHDPDNNPLTFNWKSNGNSVGSLSYYRFVSNYTSAGQYTITCEISDGTRSFITQEWTLIVYEKDQGIIVNSLVPEEGDITVDENNTLKFSIDAVDPDGNDLTYIWKLDDEVVSETASYDFIRNIAGNQSKDEYSVNLTVSDNFTRDSKEFNWNLIVFNTESEYKKTGKGLLSKNVITGENSGMNQIVFKNTTDDDEEITSVKIFTKRGRLIDNLTKIDLNYVWNGKDSRGNEVPSGVYMYQIFVGSKLYRSGLVAVFR